LRNLSTRVRIVALIAVICLPLLGMTALNAVRERAAAEARAKIEVARLAQLVAAHQDRIVEASRQVLKMISLDVPELKDDPGRCNRYLAKVLKANQDRYFNIGILNTDGTLRCSAIGADPGIDVSDRHYFRGALQTGEFTIGDYQFGRATRKPGINFGYPLLDAAGQAIAVVFVALDLNDFNREFLQLALPDHIRLTITDRNGILLARYPPEPDRLGKPLNLPLVRSSVLSPASDKGVFETRGTDNEERVFAFDDIARNSDNSIALRVIVSAPKDIIYADANANLRRIVAEILLVFLLLIAASWYGAERLMLRSIQALLRASNRISRGDLTARTGLRNSRDEISQIGHAFDEMAQSLQDRDARLAQALHELREQASTDALTGLYNRRHFREVLQRELARAKRNGTCIALVMIDIDYFKKINDTYGHGAGDLVLREMGALLKENTRAGDTACRFGGEEFALILPESGGEGARLKAETLRRAVSELDLAYDGQELGRLTASFGIALFPDHADEPDALLRAADEALYAAKGAGRNRVMIQEAPAQPPLHAVDTATRSTGKAP
jgi:diguanylate cyclase (GGDEF)-like protein